MFVERNKNPLKKRVGDCVIRAISTVMDDSWDRTYLGIVAEGYALKDMPSANYVWGSYLSKHGFYRNVISNTCPSCYSVRDFCDEHKKGRYVLATGTHAIAVIDGNFIDTWDSGDEVPLFYWKRSEV